MLDVLIEQDMGYLLPSVVSVWVLSMWLEEFLKYLIQITLLFVIWFKHSWFGAEQELDQKTKDCPGSVCVQELQGLEQFIDGDHANFIHVENVYESILLQTLDTEVNKGTDTKKIYRMQAHKRLIFNSVQILMKVNGI